MTSTDVTTPEPTGPELTAPLLTVVRGEPTPEQLAALVAVLAARSGAAEPAAAAATPLWSAPQLRSPMFPGPGAWRASGLPH